MHEKNLELAPTPHRTWLPYLDGWRGAAVSLVVAGHFWRPTFFPFASFGVELFFVLSGRLMAGILFLERYPLSTFLVRRVTRVWPALYLFLFSAAVIWRWIPSLGITPAHILGSALFVPNYVSMVVGESLGINHLWSLAVEEWTYLALVPMALASRRWNIRPLLLLWMSAILCVGFGYVRWQAGGTLASVYWNPEVRASSILIGCLAYLHLVGRPVSWWLPLVAGIVGTACSIPGTPLPLRFTVGTAGLAIAVATIGSSPRWLRDTLLSNRAIGMIGLWSFSIYLWQQPINELMRASEPLKIVGVIVVLCIGAGSYYLVEQPA